MSRAGARTTRRSVGGLCLAAFTVVALVFAGPAGAQQHHEGLIPEGNWTDDQIEEMLALIDKTEAVLPDKFPAVATYEELTAELGAQGFLEFGATAPGCYDHWINAGWFTDDHVVDPRFPESLVYQCQSGGEWKLVSAMFMLDPAIEMADIPADIAWLPGWHGHPELCFTPDVTFGGFSDTVDNPPCPEGTRQATTPVMMHVWIEDNPCNHRFGGIGVGGLHCDHGGHGGGGHDGMGDDGDAWLRPEVQAVQAAEPIVAEPSFTG